MEIFVRTIDNNGLFISDEFVEELTEFTIEEPCPAGFFHPKWDGKKWVEGKINDPTPEEIRLNYENLVSQKIRAKYSLDEEISILRQKDEKPDKWQEYFAFCEQCKIESKEVYFKKN